MKDMTETTIPISGLRRLEVVLLAPMLLLLLSVAAGVDDVFNTKSPASKSESLDVSNDIKLFPELGGG